MKHGSLFSGIGGFDLAAEWMGWQNVFHCEWNNFGRRVLNYYWPQSISYEDIKAVDFTIHKGEIDILTGGFPCQPYSLAGKRRGKDDNRHLWPEMLRAIREIQPRWVVGENVRGLVNWSEGLVFEEVQTDLENQGYEVQPFILPAAGVNAPHKRDRVWFVAKNTLRSRRLHRVDEQERTEIWQQRNVGAGSKDGVYLSERFTTDPNNTRTFESVRTDGNKQEKNKGWEGQSFVEFRQGSCDASDSNHPRLQRVEKQRSITESGKKRNKQLTRRIQPNWENFPTQPPICGGDDGLPSELDGITFPKWRNESIKGYGNAIVPQVVYQIFKAIQEYEA